MAMMMRAAPLLLVIATSSADKEIGGTPYMQKYGDHVPGYRQVVKEWAPPYAKYVPEGQSEGARREPQGADAGVMMSKYGEFAANYSHEDMAKFAASAGSDAASAGSKGAAVILVEEAAEPHAEERAAQAASGDQQEEKDALKRAEDGVDAIWSSVERERKEAASDAPAEIGSGIADSVHKAFHARREHLDKKWQAKLQALQDVQQLAQANRSVLNETVAEVQEAEEKLDALSHEELEKMQSAFKVMVKDGKRKAREAAGKAIEAAHAAKKLGRRVERHQKASGVSEQEAEHTARESEKRSEGLQVRVEKARDKYEDALEDKMSLVEKHLEKRMDDFEHRFEREHEARAELVTMAKKAAEEALRKAQQGAGESSGAAEQAQTAKAGGPSAFLARSGAAGLTMAGNSHLAQASVLLIAIGAFYVGCIASTGALRACGARRVRVMEHPALG